MILIEAVSTTKAPSFLEQECPHAKTPKKAMLDRDAAMPPVHSFVMYSYKTAD